jgi:hypothetical protein
MRHATCGKAFCVRAAATLALLVIGGGVGVHGVIAMIVH